MQWFFILCGGGLGFLLFSPPFSFPAITYIFEHSLYNLHCKWPLRTLPRIDTPTPPIIDATRLMEEKQDSAKGPDGWAISELGNLPKSAYMQLSMILAACEAHGRWPEILLEGHVTLLRKGDLPGPLGARPRAVTSVIYKIPGPSRLGLSQVPRRDPGFRAEVSAQGV